MIKFFRKIRQNLLMENKTGKYFKYAFGEIILVVIGILIALSINNWNEENLQTANFDKILDGLEIELIENIEEANFEIPLYRNSISKIKNALLNKVTRDDFINDVNLRNLISDDKFDFNSDDIKALIQNQENFPEKFKVLIPSLKKYLKIERRYYLAEKTYAEHVSKYLQYLMDNQSWYGKKTYYEVDTLALEQEVDFYHKNTFFKNYLNTYNSTIKNVLREGTSVKSASLTILAEIKRIRENYIEEDIIKLFAKFKMIPFLEKTCDYPENKNNYGDLLHLPFFNTTNKPVVLKWSNYSSNKIKLAPGELVVNSAKNRIREKDVVQVISDGVCIKKYQGFEDGFILIE
ncbi:hypothetical protein [Winogradskyella sp. A2]|uniref:hypothetical protein n=1 Tax=Winogradskyella sp. A2 TaxID=3366944 RepID=UPI00398C2D51